tara:strand:- start:39 stop:1019 length:981 start_codon:yes stop_codon:yes gene_type:complete
MAKNAVPSYESKFYINEYGISGIRDWDASYSVPEARINALGCGFIRNIYAGPLQGELSFTRDLLVNSDPVLTFTGTDPVSGTLVYDTEFGNGDEKVFGFNTGYLTNYSVNCQLGTVPTVDCSFVSFGRFGSGIRQGDLDYSGNTPLDGARGLLPDYGFANQGSIYCGFGQSGTNRVTSVSQAYDINREPLYTLTQKSASDLTGGAGFVPAEVVTHYPIEVTTNLTVEVDDFETANIMDSIRSGHFEEISLTIDQSVDTIQSLKSVNTAGGTNYLEDHDSEPLQDNGLKTMYEFNSITGQLVAESISTSIDGVLSVNLQFKDYLNGN